MAKDSPEKLPEYVQLVAVERGFLSGQMVEPGAKFSFRTVKENGADRKLPKWAQLATIPLPKKRATAADLKPKAAQLAVADKRANLAGGLPDGTADQVNGAGDVKADAQSMA